MDLPGPIHYFFLVFIGSSLILGGLGVVLVTNLIYSEPIEMSQEFCYFDSASPWEQCSDEELRIKYVQPRGQRNRKCYFLHRNKFHGKIGPAP